MRKLLSIFVPVAVVFASFEATAEPPQPVLQGQPNFRDIGGYETEDGKTVRRGLVYRSGDLSHLTDGDVERVESIGVKTVVNFLTEKEIATYGNDRLPCGVNEIFLPIESEGKWVAVVNEARRTADFSKISPDINPELHRMLVREAQPQYAAALRQIAKSDQPIAYHCSHGIHRTGTLTAVLLWTLGTPWETIRENYLLSNDFRKEAINKSLGKYRKLIAERQGISPDQVDMTNVRAFYVLEGHYIDGTRDEILERYGSIEKYLTDGLGLTQAEIDQLRSRLLK